MKVLIVGSGGREHALAWKISQSPKVDKIYCAPGNAGIGQSRRAAFRSGRWSSISWRLSQRRMRLTLTVVGMDDPLVGGIVDVFEAQGLAHLRSAKECGNPGRLQGVLQGSDEEIRYPDSRHMRPSMIAGGGTGLSGNRGVSRLC